MEKVFKYQFVAILKLLFKIVGAWHAMPLLLFLQVRTGIFDYE